MLKPKAALIAQALDAAAYWRKQRWLHPHSMNPRWVARRCIRKARLIRVLMR